MKQCFSQYVPVGSSNGFAATLPVFCQNPQEMFGLSPKKEEKTLYLRRTFFYKTIFWDDRMQFWQTPHFSPKSLKLTQRLIEFQKKVPENVPLDNQYAVKRTQSKNLAIVVNFFRSNWKTKKKILEDIVLHKIFPRPQRTEIWPHC